MIAVNVQRKVSVIELILLQVFTANSDQNTVIYHPLYPTIKGRYIRLLIVAWYRHISMRVEIYGCHLGNV